VIDLEPPIHEVAALDLNGVDDDEGEEGRKLDGVPLEVQEAWICEDLIFVLQVRLSSTNPGVKLTDAGSRGKPDTV